MNIDFEDEFYDHILQRGYDYYSDGHIKNVRVKGSVVSADVMGTHNYETSVKIEDDVLVDAFCDCPYFKSGNYCKHIAALLYYLNEEGLDSDKYVSKDEEILKMIKKIDRKELESFLANLLVTSEDLYDKFRLKFSDVFPTLTLDEYKDKIEKIIIKSAGRDGFIDYHEAYEYSGAMLEVVSEIDKLVDGKNYELAFDVATFILDTIPDTPIDDSNGSTGEVADGCIDVIENVIESILPEKSKLLEKILDYVLKEIRTGYLNNYAIEIAHLVTYFISNGLYLKKIEEVLTLTLEESKVKEYFWNRMKFIDCLIDVYKATGKSDKIIGLLEEYSFDENVLLRLVDEYLNKKRADEGISLLKDRLSGSNGRRIAEKLAEVYNSKNMKDEYKDILYKLFFDLNKYDIEVFRKIKGLYSNDEWLKERDDIIYMVLEEYKPGYSADRLLDIYIEEKMYAEAFNVIRTLDIFSIMRYEDNFLPDYNDELIDIYIDRCEIYAVHAGGRSDYRELVRFLKHIKKMKNSKKRLDALVSKLRVEYKNRPAMQDELSCL